MPRELLDLEIEEVSGVDLPANKRRFLVIKRADVPDETASPDVEKAGAVMAGHRKTRLQEAIAALQALLDEATTVDIPELTDTPVAVYSKGADMPNTVEEITKRAEEAEAHVKKLTEQVEYFDALAKSSTLRVQELEPLVGRVADLEATIEDLKLTPEEQVAKYWSKQPEAVRKQHEADELEKADLRKRLQMADERAEQAEYIQKTAGFRNFGITPDHWNLIRAIEKKLDEPERDELLRLMKAATEQTKTAALYTSMGTTGVGNGSMAATAEDQIYALAKAYADEHKCDLGTAQLAVARDNRELYERSVMEKRRHTRVASD